MPVVKQLARAIEKYIELDNNLPLVIQGEIPLSRWQEQKRNNKLEMKAALKAYKSRLRPKKQTL